MPAVNYGFGPVAGPAAPGVADVQHAHWVAQDCLVQPGREYAEYLELHGDREITTRAFFAALSRRLVSPAYDAEPAPEAEAG